MNKIKLPSNTDFGIKLNAKLVLSDLDYKDYSLLRVNFDIFLSQQPNISMFVPAVLENGEWRILEEPKNLIWQKDDVMLSVNGKIVNNNEYIHDYQNALDNVIFEGFEVKERSCNDSKFKYIENGLIAMFYYNEKTQSFESNTEYKTIEKLTPYNLTLTPKFAKELGL